MKKQIRKLWWRLVKGMVSKQVNHFIAKCDDAGIISDSQMHSMLDFWRNNGYLEMYTDLSFKKVRHEDK